MNYKIVADSSSNLFKIEGANYSSVPLKVVTQEKEYIDNETCDIHEMIEDLKVVKGKTGTACPSAGEWLEAFEDADMVFGVAITSGLSGAYNSAMVAKSEFEDTYPDKKIHIFDTLSTGAEMQLIIYKLIECIERGMAFEEIVKEALAYRDRMNTYFVLETLDTLKKNGRLTGLSAFIATALNIKPVMGAEKGNIIKLDQARGINKALQRLTEYVVKEGGNTEEKRLVISHVNAPERAQYVKEILCSKAKFKEVVITDTAGVATVYANDGGIIVAI